MPRVSLRFFVVPWLCALLCFVLFCSVLVCSVFIFSSSGIGRLEVMSIDGDVGIGLDSLPLVPSDFMFLVVLIDRCFSSWSRVRLLRVGVEEIEDEL